MDSGPPAAGQRDRKSTMKASLLVEVSSFTLNFAAASFGNSLTLWTNTLRVGLDLLATAFACFVIRLIGRGRHARFEYGLGKWENFSALLNATVMVLAIFYIVFKAVQRIRHPSDVTGTAAGIIVLALFTTLNIWMFARFRRLKKTDPSPVIDAQRVLYRNASCSSVFSLLAVVCATVSTSRRADVFFDLAGTAVILVVIFQGMFGLMRQSLSALLDEALDESLQLRLVRILADTFSAYSQLHRIRSRRSGSRIFVEIFLEFPPDLPTSELLGRAARIKESVERAIPEAEAWVVPVSPGPGAP